MEKYLIEKDIRVFCVTATAFPEGIKKAHETLHAMLPAVKDRNFYGLSWGTGNGRIVYKAAVEESYAGEAEQLGCEVFIIRKGEYMSELLKDWQKNELVVGETFQQLLVQPRLDPNGYCVEAYLNEKDMRCMVPLK
ncbi:MAG: hypothetical protein QM791_11415 [Ferruginibacter sp.]